MMRGLTRRQTVLGLMAATFPVPLSAQTPDLASLHELAKKDGQVTWYTSHFNAETAERMRRAFLARYPGVNLNLLRATTQIAYQRLSQELAAGAVQCDVFGTSDVGHFVELKARDQLERYVPIEAATLRDLYRNVDPDGYFHATAAGMITITFNSDKLQAGDVPADWRGLTDPKWAGKTSVSHPGFSGLAGTWAVVMFKLYGEKFFTDLRDAHPQVGRSIQDTVTMLASGERILAAGNVSSTLESRARGNPLAVTYPKDGVVLVASNSAIVKGTKHPNAARLLMEFLSSPEANAIFVQEFGETMHDNVAPNPANKSPNEVANNYLSVAEITDGIPKVTELWRNVFGV